MQLLASLSDTEYTQTRIKRTRVASRVVLLDEHNNVALTHIVATDQFGERNYYELPGGGKKRTENALEAALREASEELGVSAQIISELGVIHDYYNLINQENFSFYYLARKTGEEPQHFEERESRLIARVIYVPLSEALEIYEKQTKQTGVAKLVANRELIIIKMALKVLTNAD